MYNYTWVIVGVRNNKYIERFVSIAVKRVTDLKPLFPHTSICVVKWNLLDNVQHLHDDKRVGG